MNWDIPKAILDSAAFLSVIGYFWQKYVTEPRMELLRLIGEVDADLVFYASTWANPGVGRSEVADRAHDSFRRHGADLRAKTRSLAARRMLPLYGLPSEKNVQEASRALIGLSNNLSVVEGASRGEAAKLNRDYEAQIRALLKIPENAA